MAAGGMGPHGGPPPGGGGPVVDLGALKGRAQQEGPPEALTGEPIGFYSNDCTPTVQSDGSITLTFRSGSTQMMPTPQGPMPVKALTDPVRVTIPAGLFASLAQASPAVLGDAAERMTDQAARLTQFVDGGLARARAARDERQGPTA